MNNTQYIADIHRIVSKTDKSVEALVQASTATLGLLNLLRPVAGPVPPVIKPEPTAQAKPKAAKARKQAKAKPEPKPKAASKPVAVVTKEQRNRWYALDGGLRESVGMASKATKDGRVRVEFFAKKGKTASPAQIAKAVALVTK